MRLYLLLIFGWAIFFLGACTSDASNESTEVDRGGTQDTNTENIDTGFFIDPLDLFGGGPADTIPHDKLEYVEADMLQQGDILLRKGYGSVSDFIATFLDEDYPITHCGFVVREEGDSIQNIKILHSASNDDVDGMYMEPILSYIRQSKKGSMAAVRLKGSQKDREKVMSEAFRLLEKGVKFDMAFDDYDTTEMYCAEMMRYIFMDVYGEDLLDSREQKYGLDVIHMDNFFDPDHFEVLFNHHPPVETEVLDSIGIDTAQ